MGGAILIVFGVLLLTGNVDVISAHISNWLRDLHLEPALDELSPLGRRVPGDRRGDAAPVRRLGPRLAPEPRPP